MAQRYSWTIALGKEDISCAFATPALGFWPPKKDYLEGKFMVPLVESEKAMARRTEVSDML